MSIIQYIKNNQVNKIATELIEKSKNSLLLTMILNDEVNTVSSSYINLIRRKVEQGILVRRIGFGTKSDYKKALIPYREILSSKKFIFKHSPDFSSAQRLLISDKKEMLFAVYIKRKDKLVFYTKSKEIINGFVNYFNKIFDKIKT